MACFFSETTKQLDLLEDATHSWQVLSQQKDANRADPSSMSSRSRERDRYMSSESRHVAQPKDYKTHSSMKLSAHERGGGEHVSVASVQLELECSRKTVKIQELQKQVMCADA